MGCDGDVLTDWETENVCGCWEGESIAVRGISWVVGCVNREFLHGYIVRDDGLFGELEILKFCRLEHSWVWSWDFFWLWRFVSVCAQDDILTSSIAHGNGIEWETY